MARVAIRWGRYVAAAALLAQALSFSPAMANSTLPRSVVALSAGELESLYGDRTWKWKSGAGRFVETDHTFLAWARSKEVDSFAEGHWQASDDGRLCIIAKWTTAEGAHDNTTCFIHLRDRGTIYQRREPDGPWYIFKTFIIQPEDEYRKLIRQDSVSAKVERVKASLAR